MNTYWDVNLLSEPKTVYLIMNVMLIDGSLMVVATVLLEYGSFMSSILAILGTTSMLVSFFVQTSFKSARRTVCMALAGLELGIYHCADDLVTVGGVPEDVADDIIAGEYDNLLKDPLTCRYIG